MTSAEKRNHYRIQYPENDCPSLMIDGHHYRVVDLSEKGIMFVASNFKDFPPEKEITGSVTFQDNESFLVRAAVQRNTKENISVVLIKPLPLRKIMAEQRYLITKYPGMKVKKA